MNGDKPEIPGFKEVIDSVDGASSKELAVLARIEKSLSEGLAKNGASTTAPVPDTNIPRSVVLNQQRKAQQDAVRRKKGKSQPNDNHKKDINQKNHSTEVKPQKEKQKTTIRQPKTNQKAENAVKIDRATKEQSDNNHSTNLKQDGENALKLLRSPVRQEATRDQKGRFTSKDKVNDDKEARSRQRRDQAQEENDRKENALLTRVGKMMSELGDPMEADSTNAAGTAAGGSFWKAGHEVYSMAKNVGGGTLDTGKKMKDFLAGEGEDDEGQKKPGLLRRAFSRKEKDGSKNVIERQVQKQQVDATEKQTEQIKEGNKEIIDRLDELVDKQGGGNGGKGIWGTMGALFGKAFIKPIKTVGKLLGAVITAPFIVAAAVMKSAFTLGKKILLEVIALASRSRAAGALSDVADGSLPDGNGRHDKKKKPRAPKKPKKPGLLNKLFRNKGVQIATGVTATAATGYAASEAMDHINAADKSEGKEATKKTTESNVAKEEPGRAKPAEKTVAKEASTAAKTEKVASKEATTIAKEGTSKAVEKGAIKAAEEGGEKLAVKTGTKVAAKAAGKVALRSIPILGPLVGAGIDAVSGWRDTEAQQNTFGLESDQKVSARQKTEYTAANILDMGGLVSGAAGLLSSGASALGMDTVAKALDFETADIAKLIDKGVGDSISAVKSVTDAIGITNSDKNADERNKTLIEAVKQGASDTIDAINRLVEGGVSTATQIFSGKPNNGPVAVGDFKTPRPSATGKMQLDTMAGKFAALEQQHGLPPGLLRAVATTESGGNNGAVSKAGAKGMFQFMPKTAAEYGLVGEDVYDPDKSADAAAKKLSGLVKRYKGDVGLALSAYNWGEGNIQKKGMGAAPKETREYAPKVFAAMQAAGAAAPSTSINYAQATGSNDNTVAAAQPATTDPAQQAPAQQVQPVASTGNNPLFTPGKLPTDEAGAKSLIGDTTIGAVVDKLGGDSIRNAEGIRHQVSAAEILAQQDGQAPQSQQKVKETKEATAQATAVAAGSMYSRAQLPTDNSWLKDVPGGELISQKINEWGGDKIANAEGLRHQASAAEIDAMQSGRAPQATVPQNASTQKKLNVQPAALAIPSKLPAVKDMTASQMKPTVDVANEMALPKSLIKTWDLILKRLDEIAGHTKDTAEKTGDSSPKANTAQPAPRASVPLSIEDPLINEVANN
ncbi:transglycosylase SLT domain-containing protein [Citrobacter braakii]|uniref:lytic transglycosylase domain-containing protein n=1 Tax=Citrobacter braakii TaxID=57706 RepID=UPI0020000159|nr:transglycosylase SLT domain-containing protein [Citrobacter braakii]MCK2155616.1 transglycosylase SLT domain-containing protein [Citrobacter braakii]